MDGELIFAPTASPSRIARSTAPRFNTGNTPGSARSTAHASVLGAAPNAVEAPENIFDSVESWVWTSSPITVSHCIAITFFDLKLFRAHRKNKIVDPAGKKYECHTSGTGIQK